MEWGLGSGESGAITLARSMKGVAVDRRRGGGAAAALALGVRLTGTLGLALRAARLGRIASAAEVLEQSDRCRPAIEQRRGSGRLGTGDRRDRGRAMKIRDYIQDQLRERLAAAECLVLYDAAGALSRAGPRPGRAGLHRGRYLGEQHPGQGRGDGGLARPGGCGPGVAATAGLCPAQEAARRSGVPGGPLPDLRPRR